MDEDDKKVRELWMDFLSEEGYRPHLEVNEELPERSRIGFKAERARFFLYLDEKDPTFFCLTLCYRLGDLPDEPELLLEAAHAVTREHKGTKAWLDQEERLAYFHYEWFAEALPSAAIFERLIFQCISASDELFKKAREMAKPVEVE